jgi:hypothetical protein
MVEQCTWKCTCGTQCGGVKGHEKRDMKHQCNNQFCTNYYSGELDETNTSNSFCHATISGEHHWREDKGKLKCSACQYTIKKEWK